MFRRYETLHQADSNVRSSWVQHQKKAYLNSIHPSKPKFIQSQPSTSGSHSTHLSCEINEENDVISDSIDNESNGDFKPVEEKFSKYMVVQRRLWLGL